MSTNQSLKNLDVFGASIQFNYKGETTLKTQFGGLITILVFFLFLGLLQYFGMELFEKKNPQVNITNIERNISLISFEEFNPIILFNNPVGTFFPADEIEKYLTIKVNNYYVVPLDGKANVQVKSSQASKCDDVKEKTKAQQFSLSKTPTVVSFCFNFGNNTSFYNDFGTINSSFFNVRVFVCNEQRDGKKCASKDVINKVLNEIYINLIFPKYNIDPLNYTYPGKLVTIAHNDKIDNKFLRRTQFNIKNIDVKTDVGIFSEDFKTETFFTHELMKSDIGIIPTDSEEIFRFIFESKKSSQKYIRNYLKITDVLGKVGGFLNLIVVTCEAMCSFISKKSFVLQQAKDVVDFDEIENICENEEKKVDLPNFFTTEMNNVKSSEATDNKLSLGESFKKSDVIFINAYKQQTIIEKSAPDFSKILKELQQRKEKDKLRVEDIGFMDYFNSNYCKCKGVKNKDFYEALLDHFVKKFSIINIIRSCYELQLLKTVLFSSIDNYFKLFNVKVPIEDILLTYENADHDNHDQEEKEKELSEQRQKNRKESVASENMICFQRLREIQENFSRKELFI